MIGIGLDIRRSNRIKIVFSTLAFDRYTSEDTDMSIGMSGSDLIVYNSTTSQVIGRWTGTSIAEFNFVGNISSSIKYRQYRIFEEGQYRVYASISSAFRFIVLNEILYLQRILTLTGFAGTIGTDYRNTASWKTAGGLGIFRIGVRNGVFVYDETLTPTGFNGVQDIDYTQISNE